MPSGWYQSAVGLLHCVTLISCCHGNSCYDAGLL